MTAPTARRAGRATSAVAVRCSHSDQFLKLEAVLEELDVAKSTFMRWRALGDAPHCIKLPNGSLRIRRSVLDRWIAAREESAL